MSVVPDSLITYLLDNLTQILEYNYHIYADVKGNCESLQGEVEKLKGLMQDFQKYNYDSDYLKILRKQIRETVDEASKGVASYVDLVKRHKQGKGFLSKALDKLSFGKSVRKKALKISDTLDKIKNLNEKDIPNGIQFLKQQAATQQGQPATKTEPRNVEEVHVIGFEDAVKDVKKLITGGSEDFEPIAIVGMLGIGKTTLAKMVLRELNEIDYKIRAFARVSKEFEKKKVFLTILSCFTTVTDEQSKMSEDRLETLLRDTLASGSERFVIVFDDVWDERDWNRLKGGFPKKEGCRVIITTCHNQVAERTNSRIYELQLLPLNDCRKLLSWKVFGEKKCSSVENLPEFTQIAEKCDGLPLSIGAVAEALLELGEVEYSDPWIKVANSNVSYYPVRDKETKEAINKRYLTLEKDLRNCYIYLGVFPEGFEIEVWKLLRLWIAEGFIREEEEDDDIAVEDKAEKYLKELIRKNLVIVEKRRSNGNAKTIRLQRMLREFCRVKAREEQLFHEINQLVNKHSGRLDLDHCYRLCINKVIIDDNLKYNHSDHLRSFLAIPDNYIPDAEPAALPQQLVSSIPEKFKNVRVLEIQSLISGTCSDEFSKLVLLKYMAISSDFGALPWETTANLEHLQTLVIKTTSPTLQLHSGRLAMPNLKHLRTNVPTNMALNTDPKNQKKKGKALVGKNLETLSTLAPESCTQDVFDQTPNLKKLVIGGKLAELFKAGSPGDKPLLDNLNKLSKLRILKLLNVVDGSDPKSYSLPWEERFFPQQITRLTLSNTRLKWEEMSKLGKLIRLEVLKLNDNAFRGPIWTSVMGDFPCLKYLQIDRTDLMTWEVSSGDHFPSLITIKFKNCQHLLEIPRCLEHFSNLQWLVLENTTELAAKSARALELLMLQRAQKGNNMNYFQLQVSPDYY
ncbi:OLC1v1009131C1 [Oldenlandia corymbosa var. corymbosa]|uniref:OLC1v1009131C1 n=1 Tax=Oldenlandia corymbosa var. corymbosa TaxID=529605 RepID=A0AAV1DN54_OLDCO|nr:OLC1v1009131C1 [Oldenlandia corymbosa var. corymbosa]